MAEATGIHFSRFWSQVLEAGQSEIRTPVQSASGEGPPLGSSLPTGFSHGREKERALVSSSPEKHPDPIMGAPPS